MGINIKWKNTLYYDLTMNTVVIIIAEALIVKIEYYPFQQPSLV